jgi:glycogen debranching enzyme
VLLSREMFSGWGIRTLARGQVVYNPLSYHNGTIWPHDNAIIALGLARNGLTDAALKVFDSLFHAAEFFHHLRLPELFCGLSREELDVLVQYPVSCSPQAWASGALFMLLQASLGLEPDAPANILRITQPRLPSWLKRVDLIGMRIGKTQISLRIQGGGKRTYVDVIEQIGEEIKIVVEY